MLQWTKLLRHRTVTDSPDWPSAELPTTDFIYFRLHDSQQLYASPYTERELARWAEHVRAYRVGELPKDRVGITGKPRARLSEMSTYT